MNNLLSYLGGEKGCITIMNELNELYVAAPSTTQDAVERASEALKVNKEYTYTDEEIDNFLPPTLRGKIE